MDKGDDNANKRIKLDNVPRIIRHQLEIVPNTEPKTTIMPETSSTTTDPIPEKPPLLPMESNEYINADDILVKDEETVIDDSETPPDENTMILFQKSKSNHKMLMDILKKHTFAGIQDAKEPPITIEEVSSQETTTEITKNETKLADPKLQVVEYLEKSIIQIERIKNKTKRKEVFEKLKHRLEDKKMSFISFMHRESSTMKSQFKFYMRICLVEDAIEEMGSIILPGIVIDNELPIDYFNTILDSGKNTRLLPSSKIVLIYRICPILLKNLIKKTIIRIYDDYTVNRFIDVKPRDSLIDFEYYILDGYNVCLESDADNKKSN